MTAPYTGRWGRGNDGRSHSCRYCGRHGTTCPPATCLTCETTQCWGDKCAVCLYGMFRSTDGTGRPIVCGYRCDNPAVATNLPRVRNACAACLPRVTRRFNGKTIRLADDIAQALAELGQTRGIPEWRRLQWFAA